MFVFNRIQSFLDAYWLYLVLPLTYFFVARMLGFDGVYGQDAYEYMRFSESLKSFITTGTNPGAFNWPIGYPLAVSTLDFIINNTFISGQLVSILALTGIGIVSQKFIELLHPNNERTSKLYVVVFVLASPYLMRFALTAMSETLCSFFIILTFYYFYLASKKANLNYLTGVFLFAGLSIMTRNAAVVIVFIPCLVAGIYLLKKPNIGLGILCLLIFGIIISPTFFGETSQFFGDNANFSDLFRVKNFFTLSSSGSHGYYTVTLPNIIYCFYAFIHPLYIFPGVTFIIIMVYKKIKAPKVLLLSLLLYSIFIGSIFFQNKRFLVLEIALVSVIYFPAFQLLINRKFKKLVHRYWLILLLLSTNLSFGIYTSAKSYNFQQFDKYISQKMIPYQNNKLYTFWIDVALKGRGLSFDYVNLWEKEITAFETGSFVLFNVKKFSYQWQDHAVMKNWNFLKANYELELVNELKNGWQLMKIRSPKSSL